MPTRLDDAALKQLFLEARTHRAWQPRDVPDSLLKELVDLMKMAPTANNSLPARIVFVKSKAAKERLKPHLSAGNVDKTMAAPATRHRRLRPEVLRAPAEGPGPAERVRGQAGASADDGVPQRLAAGRLFHPRSAIARARLRAHVRASTMPASTRSSLPAPTSNRTFCATWASAIRRACGRGVRDLISMKSAKIL